MRLASAAKINILFLGGLDFIRRLEYDLFPA
jgi:hypothetical protein